MNSKIIALPKVFSTPKKKSRSIQSIKTEAVMSRAKHAVQPFWLYTSYVLMAATTALIFSYLLGVNAQASSGYEIQEIQGKIQKLSDDNKDLNLKISKQSSIAEIQNDYLNNGYDVVKQPQYLQVNNYTER